MRDTERAGRRNGQTSQDAANKTRWREGSCDEGDEEWGGGEQEEEGGRQSISDRDNEED